ncbi:MAG TPA: VOC family protein [Terriglobales bacterium]|jgi:PhnB protein|nr:VOC family protein [Terriglobales bacterium]
MATKGLVANKVKPIPEGFHTITPYLTVQGATKLMDFLKQAFGAEETLRTTRPDGTIGHAQMKIGDSFVMIADAGDPWKPMPTGIYLYVTDTDATYKRALQAGATSLMEPADMFYGDRNAGVQDPSGNFWWISTHIEDISNDELLKRAESFGKAQQK